MQATKHKHRLAALLCALTLLGGCAPAGERAASAGGSSGSSPTGAYVQSDVGPEAGDEFYTSLTRRGDGSLLLCGRDTANRQPVAYTKAVDGDWQSADPAPMLETFNQRTAEFCSVDFTLTPDGSWWMSSSQPYLGDGDIITYNGEGPAPSENPDERIALYKAPAGGALQKMEIPFIEELNAGDEVYSLDQLMQTDSGALCLQFTESLSYSKGVFLCIDGESGEEICRITVNPADYALYYAIVRDGTLYIPSSTGDRIQPFSLEDGKELAGIATPNLDFLMDPPQFDIAENGDLCFVNRSGIHRVAAGSTLVQDVVTGTQFAFGAPLFYCAGFLALDEGSYLMIGDDQTTSTLYQYDFDETAGSSPEDSLTLWALEETHLLRAAISAYSTQHPERPIVAEYGRRDSESGATDEDIIRTLNTRLIAGDVPDVLILDGLPADSYIQQGLLAPLDGVVDISNCYETFMGAYAREGGAYAYPAMVKLPVFLAPAGDEHAGGVSSLEELARLAGQPGALLYGSYEEMFESLYAAYSPAIFPGNGEVDELSLRKFLEATKEISDALSLTGENAYMHGGYDGSGVYPRQGYAAYQEQAARYAADIIWDPLEMAVLFSMWGPQAITPLPGGGYIPVCAAAIPAAARHPEDARAFAQLLLSDEETHNLRMNQGFSVQKGMHDAFYEGAAERNEDGAASALDYDWDALLSSFTAPAATENVLQQKLYEQAEKLYKGESSLDAATAAVLQNTQLYFAERG